MSFLLSKSSDPCMYATGRLLEDAGAKFITRQEISAHDTSGK